jgi:phage tail-like protein
MPGLNDQSKIGLGNRFKVKVTPGDHDLGSWAHADGLDVTWEVPDYRMGDGWNSRLFAPAITKYSTIKLTRAAEGKDSTAVRDWLAKNASPSWETNAEIQIILHDSFGAPVLTWDCRNVVIKKWSISSFKAETGSIALETLEFEHEGFLDDEHKL